MLMQDPFMLPIHAFEQHLSLCAMEIQAGIL